MIKIKYVYSIEADITYYGAPDGTTLNYCLTKQVEGTLKELVERACTFIVKHNFQFAYITDAKTGKLLVTATRE